MRGMRGVRGPVWYCAVVLVFDMVFGLVFPANFVQENSWGKKKMAQREVSGD